MAVGSPSLHDDLGDRYAIERELGHGATATVYLARDLKHARRSVAIKILSPDFALAVPSERFLREIRTTALLSHPHIVPLFDSDTTRSGRPFYVMRYIEGETLRDRIRREGGLAVAEALRITRQAAGALGHAHRHGVIHRDIKPGNIMLEDGHTWVTDFGIARAMAVTDSQTVTSTGVTIGTPAYMSPEQVMGSGNLDPRSDIYSLGCVLYEMIAGRMPFDGPDIQAVMNKHLVEPLPPIRGFRPDVPERVEQLLNMALAKKPADRFPTAAEFAEALSLEGAGALTPTRTQPVRGKSGERTPPWHWTPRRAMVAGGTTLAAGVAVIAAWVLSRPTLDPLRYLVAPAFEYGVGVNASMDAERLLQDALNKWTGIKIVGRSDVPASGRAGKLARGAGAGWYVRGGVSRVGDSLRVRAALYGSARDSLVRERAVNLAPGLVGADSAFSRLADRLLFDDTVWAANGNRAGTRSAAARSAFARGLSAVQRWDLASADSNFRQATDSDAAYAQAHMWLAQVRFWSGGAAATWRSSAERAGGSRIQLSWRDQAISDGLQAMGRGDTRAACDAWSRLAQRRGSDFAGWYGLANCLKSDNIVVADPRSPTGWRYRSSYQQALRAYQHSFQLLPAIHKSLRSNGYESVRYLLMTIPSLRSGRALPPDTTRFYGQPSWQADSFVLIPSPVAGPSFSVPRDRRASALRHQRQLFHEIATAWVAASPTGADALEALAVSLEMLGEPSSLDTLRQARLRETDPRQQMRMAVAAVWVQLKFSIPSDLAGMREAARLADSILANATPQSSAEARLLATLAALRGRAHAAAALARQAAADWGAKGPIGHSGPALVTFAAFGGPADSLRVLERELQSAIDNVLEASDRPVARMAWLARAVSLAFPKEHLRSITGLVDRGDPLIDAQVAVMRGDTAGARRIITNVRAQRRQFDPAELTVDALYPEASLLMDLHQYRDAAEWLGPTLDALASTPPRVFNDPARGAALVQAIALRAELAALLGDHDEAARWARVVTILWSDADEFLHPTVDRMRRLTARGPNDSLVGR